MDDSLALDYEEIEKLIVSQIEEVRSNLKENHGLDIPEKCDEFIARCLRLKDGKLEKAVDLIKAFHSTVLDFQNWEAKIQPTLYEVFYVDGAITPLLQRDSQGRRVLVLRPHLWDPKKQTFEDGVAAIWILAQYTNMEYIDAQRNGYVTIFDFSNFTLQQAWAVKHLKLLTLARWAQNGIGGRIKGVHVVFHPRIVSAIYSGIKPFLKEKLKKRIFFHSSLDKLHEHVNPKGLPTYLGGQLDPKSDECVDKVFINDLLSKDAVFKEMMENIFPYK